MIIYSYTYTCFPFHFFGAHRVQTVRQCFGQMNEWIRKEREREREKTKLLFNLKLEVIKLLRVRHSNQPFVFHFLFSFQSVLFIYLFIFITHSHAEKPLRLQQLTTNRLTDLTSV